MKKGIALEAEWVYIGSLKTNISVSNDYNDTDRTRASSAFVINQLYKMIKQSAVEPNKIIVDYTEPAKYIKIITDTERVSGIIYLGGSKSMSLNNAMASQVEDGYSLTKTLFGDDIIQRIALTNGIIKSVTLYDAGYTEVWKYIPDIWDSVYNLMQTVSPKGTISDDGGTRDYRLSEVHGVVDGKLTKTYPMTHAKAVWLNQEKNITLDQYLKNIKDAIIDNIYPVGSVYMSTIDRCPADFIGGEWER